MRWRRRLTLEQEHARSLTVIRESMAFFGHPVDDLTDEQIEEGVRRFVRASGVTVDQAAKSIGGVVQAMGRVIES